MLYYQGHIMYYSHPCSYCGRLFYTYETDKYKASERLYDIIKTHLNEYAEDDREYKFDDGKVKDTEEILHDMTESPDKPSGSYDK